MPPVERTCAARLTPPGTGAIATVAVFGPQALGVVQDLFQPRFGGKPVSPVTPRSIHLGKVGADLADEVVLVVKETGTVPSVEIHTHGGPQVVGMILDLFRSRGVEVCGWDRFVAVGTGSRLRAAAAFALAEAATVRTAAILLDQYHGALEKAALSVLAALDSQDLPRAGGLLDELALRSALGQHLTEPWRVVVAGAPNVGKSSLVNAVAGFQRSVVSPVAGTTRDVVTTRIAVDGWPVELVDTAGLHEATGFLEAEGMHRARAAVSQADLCLWVLDAAAEPVWPPESAGPVRLVVNKADLPALWSSDRADEAPRVSARTGQGLAELVQALGAWLVPDPPPPGAAVPFAPALCEGIEAAADSLRAGYPEKARGILQALVAESHRSE